MTGDVEVSRSGGVTGGSAAERGWGRGSGGVKGFGGKVVESWMRPEGASGVTWWVRGARKDGLCQVVRDRAKWSYGITTGWGARMPVMGGSERHSAAEAGVAGQGDEAGVAGVRGRALRRGQGHLIGGRRAR
ncbi:hypothetical protein GCM10012278_84480 [Nonomuraea glycinis]|uniref:Uncharacterized protein n=1 Tax=Nonomuraea glycinis TaxID=2047744 RepID=A0A918EAZ8_9ACTN|nr:hypothetical protein GCM10012278_84480 [Nonomuraea glycinis]